MTRVAQKVSLQTNKKQAQLIQVRLKLIAAHQNIDRAEAFDDASSVSSSTMTEENPTVKVNRALLERMATISQKLSEKVEEARTSDGNSHSSSEHGNGYRRQKQNPQDS